MLEILKNSLIGFIIGVVVVLIISKPLSNWISNKQLKWVKRRIIQIGQNEGLLLKTCPFCGSNTANLIMDYMEDGTEVYKMVCDTELGGCGGSTQWCDNQIDAILLWNARPDDYAKFMNKENKDGNKA